MNAPDPIAVHQLLTHDENMADRKRKGRDRPMKGEAHGSARLTEDQVREIRARRAQGELPAAIGADYGIAATTVRGICNRHRWNHVK